MSRLLTACIVLVIACAWNAQVSAQSRTQDGATVGGVAGAVIGGIIGHQNDETPEGALIGGAVGAIAGGLIGNAQDQQLAREQSYRQQIWQQRQLIQSQNLPIRRSASIADVIEMANSGVGDSVIINHLQTNGVERKLEVHDIISMHHQGVSETVIASMQRAPLGVPTMRPTYVERPATVIVEQRVPYYHVHPPIYQAYPMMPTRPYWR
jgi:outer membrane lipoprotein SlyB